MHVLQSLSHARLHSALVLMLARAGTSLQAAGGMSQLTAQPVIQLLQATAA